MTGDEPIMRTLDESVEAAIDEQEETEKREHQRQQDIKEIAELYRKAKEVRYLLPVLRWLLRKLPKFPEN